MFSLMKFEQSCKQILIIFLTYGLLPF